MASWGRVLGIDLPDQLFTVTNRGVVAERWRVAGPTTFDA